MKTLKELLEGAHQDPWILGNGLEDRHGNRIAGVVYGGWGDPKAEATLQLIARCNPATMRLVLQALEAAQDSLPLDSGGSRAAFQKVSSAIRLLNGASHGEQGEGR